MDGESQIRVLLIRNNFYHCLSHAHFTLVGFMNQHKYCTLPYDHPMITMILYLFQPAIRVRMACVTTKRNTKNSVFGRLRFGIGTANSKELFVSTVNGCCLLSPPPSLAQRFKTAQSIDQSGGTIETSRLWFGSSLWNSREVVYSRSCNALVPGTRRPAGVSKIFDPRRYMERRLHLCGNGQRPAPGRGDIRGRPTRSYFSSVGNAQTTARFSRHRRIAGIQPGSVSALSTSPGWIGEPRPDIGSLRSGFVESHAAIRPFTTDYGTGSLAASFLRGHETGR